MIDIDKLTMALFEDEDCGWESFHDVLIETELGETFTKEECKEYFDRLSTHTKFIAFEWGLGDTVFGDEAYKELLRSKSSCQ